MRKIENEAFVGQRLIFAVSQRISALAENLFFMDPFVVAFSSMNNSMYMIGPHKWKEGERGSGSHTCKFVWEIPTAASRL
ncbi:hypothetical protein P3S67_018453 [Capsicum chacoense]